MRNQASSWVSLVMVAGVTAAGFIGACGGKVVVDGSNNGSGGAGGDGVVTSTGLSTTSSPVTTGVITGPITGGSTMSGPVTVGSSMDVAVSVGPGPVTVGSSMDVAVSVGPSSSSGGTNACQDACDKATTCGLDICSQFNVNCQNPVPQARCPLNCIANGSCGDIAKLAMQNFATPLGFCILSCQGMGPGSSGVGPGSSGVGPGSSGVGASSGSGNPMACQQCTVQQCGSALLACGLKMGPGSCSQWLQCAQGCGQDSQCLFGCDSQFPNAAAQYGGVYSCLCNKCDAQCPSENACDHILSTPSGSGPSGGGP